MKGNNVFETLFFERTKGKYSIQYAMRKLERKETTHASVHLLRRPTNMRRRKKYVQASQTKQRIAMFLIDQENEKEQQQQK